MPIDWPSTRLSFGLPRGRVRCEPGWRLEPAWSDRLHDFDLWLVWAGRGRMRLSSGEIELRPGVCLWMRPARIYHGEQDPSDRLGVSFVHFDLHDRTTGCRVDNETLPGELHAVDPVYGEALLRQVVAHLDPVAPQGAERRGLELEIAERLFGGLLRQLDLPRPDVAGRAAAARRRAAALKAAALIRDEPGRSWHVAELARDAGYSADHFSRAFKEALGRTPQEFVVHARVERARQLLAESSLPVGRVAELLGYASPYFFSRQFRQLTGRTPRQHRQGAGSGGGG